MELRVFSFFSGSGFLDLGFERNGYSVAFVNELMPSFLNAYKYARKQMGLEIPLYGYSGRDINEYLIQTRLAAELKNYVADARKDGAVVGFIGGPPCPDFSIAGKQRGRAGDNGKLSLSYVRLIIEQKPDFFLFENVKGLWKTNVHRQFYEELKDMLRAADYLMFDRMTNALEFGVPQDRERILLFGIKNEILPFEKREKIDFPWIKYATYDMQNVRKVMWPKTDPFIENGEISCPDGVPRELTVQYWFDRNSVDAHLNGMDAFRPRSGIKKMKHIDEGDDSRKSYKRLHRWRYSPTVAYGNNEVHLHPYKVRRLTVAEALSLQSLPKDFVLPPEMSLTDKFKTVGNGVPYLLADGVAKTISYFLKGIMS